MLNLVYEKGGDGLCVYSDADWATDKLDRRSVSSAVIFHGSNPLSWSSKKQSCVALSTVEAECIGAAATAQELV